MSGGGFYIGTWFVLSFPTIQNEWVLPLDGDYQHLKDTSNVEELNVFPEDMDVNPEDIQVGADQWITFTELSHEFYSSSAPGIGGFYVSDVPGIGGFYLQDIGI